MGATKLRTLTLTVLLAAGTVVACNRVGDEYCDVGTDLTDQTDQCPFGPPGGPGSHSDGCQGVSVNTNAAGCATTALSWAGADGIWYTQLRESCSTGGCHELNAGQISLPYANATTAFNSLAGYNKQGLGKYIDPTDASRTWILCNLQRVKGGGDAMPLAPRTLPAGALDKVTSWAQCGEKLGIDSGGGPGPMDAGGGG